MAKRQEKFYDGALAVLLTCVVVISVCLSIRFVLCLYQDFFANYEQISDGCFFSDERGPELKQP